MKSGAKYRKLLRRQQCWENMGAHERQGAHHMHKPGGKPGYPTPKGVRNRAK